MKTFDYQHMRPAELAGHVLKFHNGLESPVYQLGVALLNDAAPRHHIVMEACAELDARPGRSTLLELTQRLRSMSYPDMHAICYGATLEHDTFLMEDGREVVCRSGGKSTLFQVRVLPMFNGLIHYRPLGYYDGAVYEEGRLLEGVKKKLLEKLGVEKTRLVREAKRRAASRAE